MSSSVKTPMRSAAVRLFEEKAFAERRQGLAVRLTGESDHKADMENDGPPWCSDATDAAEAKRVVEAQRRVEGHSHPTPHQRLMGMTCWEFSADRAFGDFQLKAPTWSKDIVSNVPEISATLLMKDDMFVITACDGLWDVLEDQEAVNLVIEGMSELGQLLGEEGQSHPMIGQVMARLLIEEALARGTSDNVTCVVVFP
eukprot:Skav218222  [mRNA]  locus=scaffold1366:57511:61468:- [translate_table: standard]